ncbi:MAG: aspartate carbamoyltransferase regulatory subunit [Candidatus Hadarchaeales archaeon]
MKEELIVKRIKDGTVIDHIPAGQALHVLRLLGLTGREGLTVAVVMHVPSKKLGKKDIVKVEGKELRAEEVNKIALLAPQATINTIKNYRVTSKLKVELPEKVRNLIRCTNPNCITNKPREPVLPLFTALSRSPLLLCCEYCGAYITQEEVVEQFAKSPP